MYREKLIYGGYDNRFKLQLSWPLMHFFVGKHTCTVEDIATFVGIDVDTLRSECSDKVLIEIANSKVHVDWRAIGKELRLDKEDLDRIQQAKTHKKIILILKKWKEKFGFQATNQTLLEVALVQTIQKSYQTLNYGAKDILAIHIAKIIGAGGCWFLCQSTTKTRNNQLSDIQCIYT